MNPTGFALVYEFERDAVEAKDLRHFLNVYPPHRLPRGEQLRDYFNTFVFSVDGYGADSRELCTIPEVRRFYRHFYREWPFWLFFCNLDTPNLLTMSLCCVETVHTMRIEGVSKIQFAYKTSELGNFMDGGFARIAHLFGRAGMTADDAERRRVELSEYFKRDWPSWQDYRK